MNVPNDKQEVVSDESTRSSRRKFLTKASAGAIITTLPAASAWGTCSTSGGSGGSRGTSTSCSNPTKTLNYGRNAAHWYNLSHNVSKSKNRTVCTQFFHDCKPYRNNIHHRSNKKAATDVKNFIKYRNVVLSDGNNGMSQAHMNLGQALTGSLAPLAALYLNSKFKVHASLPIGYSSAEELMKDVWTYLYIQNGNRTPTDYWKIYGTFGGSTDVNLKRNGVYVFNL